MTQTDKFMRGSIKRRFSLTTLLQVSRLVKDLREDEMEIRFRDLNRILEESGSEQEFCQMVFEGTDASRAS